MDPGIEHRRGSSESVVVGRSVDASRGSQNVSAGAAPSVEGGVSGSTAGRLPRDMKGSNRQLLNVTLECLRQALEVPGVEVMSDGNLASGTAGGDQAWVGLGVTASGGGDDGQCPRLDEDSVEGWVDVRRRRVRRWERVDGRDSRVAAGDESGSIMYGSAKLGGETSSPSSVVVPRRDGGSATNRFASLEVEYTAHEEEDRVESVSASNALVVPVVHWKRRKAKRLGTLASHARFLQFAFRQTRRIRPGCWRRGGLRDLCFYRPIVGFACMGGSNLASESDFVKQRKVADEVLAWYRQYVELLRRLRSGRTPTAVVGYCGQGGVSEGVRRAGGASHGQDIRGQPKYEARFGSETFSQGDSRSPAELRRLKRATGAFVTMGSPPCKAHSTSLMRGKPSEEAMIEETRSAYREVGGLYSCMPSRMWWAPPRCSRAQPAFEGSVLGCMWIGVGCGRQTSSCTSIGPCGRGAIAFARAHVRAFVAGGAGSILSADQRRETVVMGICGWSRAISH